MTKMQSKIYEIPLNSIDGKVFSAEQMKKKVVLFVNTASACGYTPQYKGLEALFEKYKDKGLLVVGVPCNQFGAQEPGTEAEIQNFCEMKFNVKFPLLKKADVKGANQVPLFKFLIENSPKKEEIAWNFEKFLVGRDGEVLERFKSKVEPQDSVLVGAIEKALAH